MIETLCPAVEYLFFTDYAHGLSPSEKERAQSNGFQVPLNMRNDYFALSVICSGSIIGTLCLQVIMMIDYAQGLSQSGKERDQSNGFQILFLSNAPWHEKYDYFALSVIYSGSMIGTLCPAVEYLFFIDYEHGLSQSGKERAQSNGFQVFTS
jgi:hypothetical protein